MRKPSNSLKLISLESRIMPTGSEFLVNSGYTTGTQRYAAVAANSSGSFVIAWDQQDGAQVDIYAQRYASNGSTVGSPILINSDYTTSSQFDAALAMDSNGDFVVTWTSLGQDGDGDGVYVRKFNSNGTAATSTSRVNTFTTNYQNRPAISMDSSGNFVIAWNSFSQDGSNYGVYFQRFNASAAAQGSETLVNTTTTSAQSVPCIAVDSDGDFVVAWQNGYSSPDGIYARRYNSSGTAQGGEFLVNTNTNGAQIAPAIASNSNGDFMVSWIDQSPTGGSGWDILAQLYNSSGTAQGTEFFVNSYGTGNQSNPKIAVDSNGEFAITWDGPNASNSNTWIYAKRYKLVSAGTGISPSPISAETRINESTSFDEQLPDLAAGSNGTLVFAWARDVDVSTMSIDFDNYARIFTDVPKVQSVQIDNGTAQRSVVRSLTITFSSVVSFSGSAAAAFSLSGPASVGTISADTSASTGSNTIAKITYSGTGTEYASLVDGNWALSVDMSQITANQWTGAGSNSTAFHRLFGDADGNKTVNTSDLNAFKGEFGGSSYTFDFDNDGDCDTIDLNAFQSRFGSSV